MKTKKLILTAALASTLVVGTGAALAQDEGTAPVDPAAPLAQEWGFGGGRGPMGGEGFRDRFGQQGPRGQGGPRGPLNGIASEGELADLLEEYTGLDAAALREARLDGQTLAELIEANDQSVDDFIAAAAEVAYARVDELLADERITEEQAGEMKAQILERITALVNGDAVGPRMGAGLGWL